MLKVRLRLPTHFQIKYTVAELKNLLMKTHTTLRVDDFAVKFTPDGKVSVLDAIETLMASGEAPRIWNLLVQEQPEIANLCEHYNFHKSRPECVVDSEGWEQIEDLLLNYMLDHDTAG